MSDALEPRELSTLSAYDLGQVLNDIDADYAAFARVAVSAEKQLADVESQLLYEPDNRDLKAARLSVRGTLRAARLQLSALNKRQSRVQTILRTLQDI